MSLPPISGGPLRPPLATRPRADAPAPVADPLDTASLQAAVPDVEADLAGLVHQPWKSLPPSLASLGEERGDAEREAFTLLRRAEVRGIWGDGGDAAARQDLAILTHDLPAHASIVEAARGYDRLMEVEKGAHADPTPHARLAARAIVPTLREGESAVEAADAYDTLRRYCASQGIDGSKHAVEAWSVVDGQMLPCQSRKSAVTEYVKDPRTFAARQAAEKARYDARQAEVKRIAEQVSREPRGDLRIEDGGDGWLMVGGVRVPRRA